ncbi:MAG: monofunctional biosynthetic peptidoglycan transglycosylase [Holophagales bacterium]|nr:monofunctional biosynthetic peptidoglycan transglycosylase [Holophagales bacterium]
MSRLRGVSRRARLLLVVAAGLFLFLFVFAVPVPRIVALRFSPPSTTAFLEARRERLIGAGKSGRIDRRPVPIEKVSPHLVTAVLVAEDARFFEHHGIDWDAVRAARARNRKYPKRRPVGASTITQQLAKNLWLSPDRSWTRKGREAAIALTMELLLPKRTILAHYLSGIEWGERVYGCEAAARRYFGVSASALTRSQAAWLAAMIPAPRLFLGSPGRHERRAARILSRMARAGDMTPLLLEETENGDAR